MPRSTLPTRPSRLAVALLASFLLLDLAWALEPWPRSRDYRTLAAELLVLAGDARRLRDEELTVSRRHGLWSRIQGGLAALPLMYREAGLSPPRAELHKLRERSDPESLRLSLSRLAEAAGFDTRGILPPDERPAALALARALHQAHCAACHDGAPMNPDQALAAEDLFDLAASMSELEFAARLHNGVRGDQLTGLETPLSDMDQSALIALYRGGRD